MRPPGGPLAIAVALVALSMATDQPLIVAASLAGALLLLNASPGSHGLIMRVALISGLVLTLINPFVAVEGDRVLVAGPTLGPFDLEVTLEELLFGLVSGARLATAILAVAAFLALVDPDRLQARISRIAPRSALTVALAARLMPALRRDAHDLGEALDLRGRAPDSGRIRALRRSTVLVEPLVATSLDRGVGIAEAMAARGYGSGAFTHLPEARPARGDRIALVAGIALLPLALALALGALPYAVYPMADPILTLSSTLAAASIIGASLLAACALRSAA